MEKREEQLLHDVQSGHSIFRRIPEDIGEIVYCDSDNPKAEPDTKELTRIKIILSILISAIIIAFCWIVFDESPIFDTIATVVVIIGGLLAIKICLTFNGRDFFVGTKGAATMFFEESRDNIVSKELFYFRDFDDLLLEEVRKFRNGVYVATDYHFLIYGHLIDNERKLLVDKSGSYDQKDPGTYYTDQTFRFWKKIEESWSEYKLNQIKDSLINNESIGFNLYMDNKFCTNYIIFKGHKISIGGKEYDSNNIKKIRFENGNLIIEDINHSSKLFGLIEKGDKETIPLHSIGNKEIFIKFFQYFASSL